MSEAASPVRSAPTPVVGPHGLSTREKLLTKDNTEQLFIKYNNQLYVILAGMMNTNIGVKMIEGNLFRQLQQ